MQAFHGAHTAYTLHLGQCWTDEADIADSYAGRNGVIMEATIDLSGLDMVEVDGYDRDADEAPGDMDVDAFDCDVIVYDDEDMFGTQHTTWRLVSERAVAAVALVGLLEESEDEDDEE